MATTRPGRREFLAGTLAAGLSLAVAGCRRAVDDQTLRIFVYAGGHERTMREVFLPAFEALTGKTAVLVPGWWGSTAQLKQSPKGQPPYDLMIVDATEGYPAVRDGLFQQIDPARLPNVAKLTPTVLDNWVYRDRYGVTFPDSVQTLAYRKDAIDFVPKTWDDLLRDDVRGRVALYSSFYMSLYTFACMKAAQAGKPGTAHDLIDDDLPGVLAFAKEQRDRVGFWWKTSTDMSRGLVQKDCALGNMHSPEMLVELRERPELGAVVPEADRAFVQVFWAIPDGTPRKESAETALNLLFSEELQTGFARRGSATALLSAAETVAAEDPLWRSLYPSTEEGFRALRYYPYDAYFRDWKGVNDAWDREVLRKS
jgi:spermidine/putrescine-binding protein